MHARNRHGPAVIFSLNNVYQTAPSLRAGWLVQVGLSSLESSQQGSPQPGSPPPDGFASREEQQQYLDLEREVGAVFLATLSMVSVLASCTVMCRQLHPHMRDMHVR
jgi:hypothetical protein